MLSFILSLFIVLIGPLMAWLDSYSQVLELRLDLSDDNGSNWADAIQVVQAGDTPVVVSDDLDNWAEAYESVTRLRKHIWWCWTLSAITLVFSESPRRYFALA